MITPAISVLSAVEGLEVATPVFRPYVVPITIAILIAPVRGAEPRHGAASARIFGPVMLLWFATLGVLGAVQIVAASRGARRGESRSTPCSSSRTTAWHGFLVLGSVFLAVTGGEALYADMGHFGMRPIRVTVVLVRAARAAAQLLRSGRARAARPERGRASVLPARAGLGAAFRWSVLTTLATVIASQAVISGAFSLTRQAVQLGYLPRVDIEHTSETQIGQIYIPGLNWLLMVACIGLVLGFRSSSNLAAAYGVAVTTDMVFTTILFAVVARDALEVEPARGGRAARRLPRRRPRVLGREPAEDPERRLVPARHRRRGVHGDDDVEQRARHPRRAARRARVAASSASWRSCATSRRRACPGRRSTWRATRAAVPHALLHNLKHNKVLHERVVLLAMLTDAEAHVRGRGSRDDRAVSRRTCSA